MRQGQLRGEAMVERDIGDAADHAVPGNCRDRDWEVVFECGVDGDERLCAAAEQHAAVLFDQIFSVAMMRGEIKIAGFHQVVANTAHDLRVVTVAEFGDEDADGQRAAIAERTSEETGLVIEFLGGGFDAVASGLRDSAARNVIQHHRNCRGI